MRKHDTTGPNAAPSRRVTLPGLWLLTVLFILKIIHSPKWLSLLFLFYTFVQSPMVQGLRSHCP